MGKYKSGGVVRHALLTAKRFGSKTVRYKSGRRLKQRASRLTAGMVAAVFASGLLIAYALEVVPVAQAATGNVFTDGDITRGFAACTGTGCTTAHYTTVDEGTTANNTDYANTGTAGAGGEVEEFTMGTLSGASAVSSVAVNVNAWRISTGGSGGNADTISINLRIGGSLQTASTCTPPTAFNATTGWCTTATFNGTWTQSNLDGMQVHITRNVNGGGAGGSRDDDLAITTVYATVTYTSPPTSGTFSQASHRWFDNADNGSYNGGTNWSQVTNSVTDGSLDDRHAIVFKDKIWVLGGADAEFRYSDLYSSSDGVNWTDEGAAAWPGRFWGQLLVYDNKMWMMGGWSSMGAEMHDVWYTSDGTNWTEATSAAGWPIRNRSAGVVYDGKMWIFGGSGTSADLNDVWYSTNGSSWTQVTTTGTAPNTMWSARSSHNAVVFNNKMYLFGGSDSGALNDVWSSTDGATWTRETASAGWSARAAFGATVYDNKMWILGSSDAWYSTNGASWTQATAAPGWSARAGNIAASFNGKLVNIIGANGAANNDVWFALPSTTRSTTTLAAQDAAASATNPTGAVRLRMNLGVSSQTASTATGRLQLQYARQGSDASCDTSFTGETYQSVGTPAWTQATASPGWTAREGSGVAYNGKLWTIAGLDGTGRQDDVWYSSDGVTWQQATGAAAFGGRENSEVVVFNDKMWLIGGFDGAYKADVWSSTDGVTWSQATANTGFAGRYMHSAVVHNGKIYVYGGMNATTRYNDVWSSSDGTTWAQDTAAAGWSIRQGISAASFNGKLWAVGGSTASGRDAQVWYSTTGATWTQATTNGGWTPKNMAPLVVKDDKMWLLGGNNGSGVGDSNDVWTSTDGFQWTRVTTAAGWTARGFHAGVVFNNKIYVYGGFNEASTEFGDVWFGDIEVDGYDNPNSSTTGTTASVAGDPTAGGTLVQQVYTETGSFGNDAANIPVSQFGVFDFSLSVAATYDQTYCFRVVTSAGANLSSYSSIPTLDSCAVPRNEYIMRHGNSFCKGSKKSYFWSL